MFLKHTKNNYKSNPAADLILENLGDVLDFLLKMDETQSEKTVSLVHHESLGPWWPVAPRPPKLPHELGGNLGLGSPAQS